jgi:hypothetical protein
VAPRGDCAVWIWGALCSGSRVMETAHPSLDLTVGGGGADIEESSSGRVTQIATAATPRATRDYPSGDRSTTVEAVGAIAGAVKRVVVVVGLAAAWAHPVRAQVSATADATTYVSDKFKIVARRLAEQVAASKLADACGRERPVCTLVIGRLSAVFIAAIEKDKAGVKDALIGFFSDSAVHGALQHATGALFDSPRAAEVLEIAAPLTICLGAYLTQRRPPAACRIENARAQLSAALHIDLARCDNSDCVHALAFVEDLDAGRVPDASAVIYLLEAIASQIDREDVRVYLDELHHFLDDGPGIEGGLFEAVDHFLRTPDPSFVTTAIAHYTAVAYAGEPVTGQGVSLMYPRNDAQWDGLRKTCPQLDQAFGAWQKARDAGFFDAVRQALAGGHGIDLSALEALATARCTGDLRRLQRFVAQLAVPLRLHDSLVVNGVAILAAAALIDYLHFGDAARLDRDVRALLGLALERVALPAQIEALRTAAAGDQDALKRFETSCEVLDLRHLLAFRGGEVAAASCTRLAGGAAGTTVAVAGAGGVSIPEVVAVRAADLEHLFARMAEVVAALRSAAPATAGSGAAGAVAHSGVTLRELVKLVGYVAADDRRAARQVALRYGIALLVDEVDHLSEHMLATRAVDCEARARSTSIFSGIDAACAAHILIQSAYYPIADVLWDSGLSAANVSSMATQTYQSLLQNKALDRTPIILDLGLGVNHFGNGGNALTVVDKFGLAFYKRSTERWTFETGPFVGGFLDALVRTAASTGTDQRRWIAGYTIGVPRLAGVDVGVELHAGAAIPFEIKADDIGFVVGATLVVPFSTLFQSGD